MPYKCPVCGVGKRSTGALSQHVKTAHDEGGKGRRRVTCEVCGKVVTAEYFTDHMKIHREVKDEVCHFCGKAFVAREALRMHLRVHTGEKPYACHVCGKAFNQKTPHTRHLQMHKKNGSWVEKVESGGGK